MTILVTVVIVLVPLVAIVLITIYSGAPDVAATDPHWPVTAWVLNTAMENSVRAAAADVNVPADYNEIEIRVGYSRFSSMCLQCHGAPGMEPIWLGKGLRPEPPELSQEAADWTAVEIFWIVKHAIKMTGMPALAPTHNDDAIWTLTAFVERMEGVSPEEYRAFRQSGDGASGGGAGQQDGWPARLICKACAPTRSRRAGALVLMATLVFVWIVTTSCVAARPLTYYLACSVVVLAHAICSPRWPDLPEEPPKRNESRQ